MFQRRKFAKLITCYGLVDWNLLITQKLCSTSVETILLFYYNLFLLVQFCHKYMKMIRNTYDYLIILIISVKHKKIRNPSNKSYYDSYNGLFILRIYKLSLLMQIILHKIYRCGVQILWTNNMNNKLIINNCFPDITRLSSMN